MAVVVSIFFSGAQAKVVELPMLLQAASPLQEGAVLSGCELMHSCNLLSDITWRSPAEHGDGAENVRGSHLQFFRIKDKNVYVK